MDSLPAVVKHALLCKDIPGIKASASETIQQILRLMPSPLIAALPVTPVSRPTALTQPREGWGIPPQLAVDAGPTPRPDTPRAIRWTGNKRVVEREDASSQQLNLSMSATMIVFVCTGNTCRSPMAEAIFRRLLSERLQCDPSELSDRGYVVISAGLAAMQGSPASPEAVTILSRQGIDLQDHRSQPLTAELLQRADQVYTMTQSHRNAILSSSLSLADQVELLSRDGSNIADPIGAGMNKYETCCRQIETHLRGIIEQMPVD